MSCRYGALLQSGHLIVTIPLETSLAMPSTEALGWAAATLTLLTFICRDMRRLRVLALAANAAFIAYGTLADLAPVLVLHLALVPVNLWRLSQVFDLGAPWNVHKSTVGGTAGGLQLGEADANREPGSCDRAKRSGTATRRHRRLARPSWRKHQTAPVRCSSLVDR